MAMQSLTGLNFPASPVSNITPFTYRDGYTFLEVIESFRDWLNENIVPQMNENLAVLIDNYNAALAEFVAQVNESLDTALTDIATNSSAEVFRLQALFNTFTVTLTDEVMAQRISTVSRTNLTVIPRPSNNVGPVAVSGTSWGTGGAGVTSYPTVNGFPVHRMTWTQAPTALVSGGDLAQAIAANRPVVVPGTTMAFSVEVVTSKTQSMHIQAQWLNVSGNSAGTANGVDVVVQANIPTTLTLVAVVPASAASVRTDVDLSATGLTVWAIGDTLDISKLMLQVAATPGLYFDGNTVIADGRTFEFTGVPFASTSVEYTRTLTRTAVEAVIVSTTAPRDVGYHARRSGVIADGVTNDSVTLVNAANAAIALRLPLILPAGASIALATKATLPAGLVMNTNGATFVGTVDSIDYMLTLNSNTRIYGGLRLVTFAGAQVRGVNLTSISDVSIDYLTVKSPAAGVGVGSGGLTRAINITTCTNIRIPRMDVTNFDYPVAIVSTPNVVIDNVILTTFVRGIYISDCENLTINSGLISGASPNAGVNPGHNGILIDSITHDATNNIRINNVSVRDAGEHGFRVGGNFRVNRLWFNRCSAINVGGAGFKVLGGTQAANNYHENIYVESCFVEDAGQSAGNAAGVMLEYVRRAFVTNLIVRKNLKAYSASHGVQVQAAENVIVTNLNCYDTLTAGFAVSFILGNVTNVKLVGGLIQSSTGDGVYIDFTNRTFRRVAVENFPQIEIAGTGFCINITNSGAGSVIGGAWMTWQSAGDAARQYNGLLGSWFCDVRATFSGDPQFKNGSRWLDSATGITRQRVDTWKVPVLA